MDIPSPSVGASRAERILDCALALQPAFEALASRAEASGWSAAEAAGALLELSLDRSRKTGGNAAEDWVKAQALRERRR